MNPNNNSQAESEQGRIGIHPPGNVESPIEHPPGNVVIEATETEVIEERQE